MQLNSVFHGKNVLWTFIIVTLLVGVTMVNVASASPDTYFSVDPSLIVGTPEGKFEVNITITGAPDTYAWEIYVNWDPDRLELINVKEGDFLHRWVWKPVPPPPGLKPKYLTDIAYVPPDEANVEGQVIVSCTLVGNPETVDWASGDGWLCTLEFLVQAGGSTLLNLFDTRLADYLDAEGYPAHTEYDNEDCLIYATNFYRVTLRYIIVNGRIGRWSRRLEFFERYKRGRRKVPRAVVGEENLLEALITNTGSFDVDVQVFFEIRNAAGYWIATIATDIEALSSGGSTTFSAHWTANKPDVYYITAYAFYNAPPIIPTVTIADGSSIAFRLSVEPAE